jgi:hypothetical protein
MVCIFWYRLLMEASDPLFSIPSRPCLLDDLVLEVVRHRVEMREAQGERTLCPT